MPIDYPNRLLNTYASNMARRLDYPSSEARKLLKEVGMGDGFQDVRECEATGSFIEFVTEARLQGNGQEDPQPAIAKPAAVSGKT